MTSPSDIAAALCQRACRPQPLAAFRHDVLERLRPLVPYDAAFFHELSPRVPLDRAALVGIDVSAVVATLGSWDELAVALAGLRQRALDQGGVATTTEALPPRSAGRRAWNERVRPMLGRGEAMITHLVVDGRIVAAILMVRRTGGFSDADAAHMRALAPVLSVTDALRQTIEGGALRGLAAELRCEDQRLTPRQRELVLLVALGHTDADIARALGISANTVRNHLVQVRERLGAANRADIVRLAVLR